MSDCDGRRETPREPGSDEGGPCDYCACAVVWSVETDESGRERCDHCAPMPEPIAEALT